MSEPHKRGGLALTVLLALFVVINYVDRGAIGIAAPKLKGDLHLDHEQFGLAVSAFAWVYAPAQLAIGWLSGRMCVYRIVAGGLALWALATFFTGFVGGLTALVTMRLLLGIGEGVAFPCSSKIIAAHVPDRHRGLANAALAAALAIGPAIGTFAGGHILATHGWRPIFWIFGALTLVWLPFWFMTSKPHWSTRAERRADVPLRLVAGRWAPWSMGIGHFCNTYPFFFALAWLPLFLTEKRGIAIPDMTAMLTMVYIVQGVGALLWGWLSDRLVAAGRDEGKVRRALMVVYQTAMGTTVIAAGLASTRTELFAALLVFGLFGGMGGANPYAISQIFAGRAAGAWVGIMNGVGNTSGIVGPILTGAIIQATGGNYLGAFWLTAAIALFGSGWWWLAVPKIAPCPDLVEAQRSATTFAAPAPAPSPAGV
ncbi:MFS transporter [Sphingomonas sp. ASV193]|uniref:MFS transporter n=1 Tax=Sphingomonas sp. ASV193 TaxID=3144405 RepID=UPI0032E877D8